MTLTRLPLLLFCGSSLAIPSAAEVRPDEIQFRRQAVTRMVFDAAQNIRGGVRYLAWLLKRFNGNLTLAAAGYNAGEGAVDKYGGVPPYNETQRYVVRVGQLAERYRGALNPVASPLQGGLSAR